MGRGIPLPSRLGGLGERRKLPRRGPGLSPGRKRVLMHFELDRTQQLKCQGLSRNALHIIFTAIVLSIVTYALPAFLRQLSNGDKDRLDSLFCKTFKRGLCSDVFFLLMTLRVMLIPNYFVKRQMIDTVCTHSSPSWGLTSEALQAPSSRRRRRRGEGNGDGVSPSTVHSRLGAWGSVVSSPEPRP